MFIYFIFGSVRSQLWHEGSLWYLSVRWAGFSLAVAHSLVVAASGLNCPAECGLLVGNLRPHH